MVRYFVSRQMFYYSSFRGQSSLKSHYDLIASFNSVEYQERKYRICGKNLINKCVMLAIKLCASFIVLIQLQNN